jgi:hypothetical protein
MAWHMGDILALLAFRDAAVFDGAGVGIKDNGFLKRLKDSDTSHSPSRPSGGQLPSLDSASYRDVLLSRLSRTCLWRRLRSLSPHPCCPASLSSQKRLLTRPLFPLSVKGFIPYTFCPGTKLHIRPSSLQWVSFCFFIQKGALVSI